MPPYVLFTGVLILSATLNALNFFESISKNSRNRQETLLSASNFAFASSAIFGAVAINAWDYGGIFQQNASSIHNYELGCAINSSASAALGSGLLYIASTYDTHYLNRLKQVFILATKTCPLTNFQTNENSDLVEIIED
jgi:hypothetical protein